MKFYIHTTGCKANQWDTHVMASGLRGEGFSAGPLAEADVIVINACALTEGAERDTRRFVRSAAEKNPGAQIILTGCHGQVYPEKAFGAATVLGQTEKFSLREYIGKAGTYVSTGAGNTVEKAGIRGREKNKTRFFFKIQDGCDRFCTYCVVPLARGTPRSRPLRDVLYTMERLAGWGVQEVVLTGIEVSSYRDEADGTDLKGLLKLLEKSETPGRIRLSSIDPLYVDEEFTEIMAESRKITRSVHIPLQSGCDRILEKMGRRYATRYIEAMVDRLTGMIPGIGIGMDVIVGFPTESEEEFAATYRFIESLDIYYLHVFPFSPRERTPAASMEGMVPAAIKKERVSRLKRLDGEKRKGFYYRFVGEEAWVIPEGKVYRGSYVRGLHRQLSARLPGPRKMC